METHPCSVRVACFCIVVCCSILAQKRARDVDDDDEPDGPVKQRRRNCEDRGVLRQGVAVRLMRLDAFIFRSAFLLLTHATRPTRLKRLILSGKCSE